MRHVFDLCKKLSTSGRVVSTKDISIVITHFNSTKVCILPGKCVISQDPKLITTVIQNLRKLQNLRKSQKLKSLKS